MLQWFFYEDPNIINIDEEKDKKYTNGIVSLFHDVWKNQGGVFFYYIGTVLLLISSCINYFI